MHLLIFLFRQTKHPVLFGTPTIPGRENLRIVNACVDTALLKTESQSFWMSVLAGSLMCVLADMGYGRRGRLPSLIRFPDRGPLRTQ